MSFTKLGEYIEISRVENTESCIPAVDPEILANFRKTATSLKKIAPKAEDFLYFSAVMMHAAEAAAINDDGTPKLNARGEVVQVGWDKSGGTWKWTTNDRSIKPYKNSNGDIFPEEELVKAYQKWKYKPLCIDHKSSSVEHVRGFIVDTYYDRSLKRVVALCALDKASYPQLARQVSTGVSNCVSMGTAVGRAICTEEGCHRVARIPEDFCDHMSRKTCYGEINIDLNPIELSIVVNGADPKANIKHIIAAAQTLNSYVENKSNELSKFAKYYSANITYDATDGKGNGSNTRSYSVSGNTIEEFKEAIDHSMKELEDISTELSNTNNTTSNYTDDVENSTSESKDSQKEASSNDSIEELKKVTSSIENTLIQMKQSLEKLSKSNYIHEENMSGPTELNKKAYYQGTEEPTPGQPKYDKDPKNDKTWREWEKATNANVGSSNGIYPEDLEKKKMLARAEAEERALRRSAIVASAKQALENKKGYYSASDPSSKPKYPIDKLNEDVRDAEKANGDTGPIDGMFPGDEKKKELLGRASLRGQFNKTIGKDGRIDMSKSAWKIYLGDELILNASVQDLSGVHAELMYDSIATKEFGSKLIEKVKVQGADKVRSLIKSGQVTPETPTPAPTMETPPATDTPPTDASTPANMTEEPHTDPSKSGDPKDVVSDLAAQLTDTVSDLQEAVSALTGEQNEMGAGDIPVPETPPTSNNATVTASNILSTSNLNILRKEINSTLTGAMKEAIANLNDHKEELEFISTIYNKNIVTASNKEFANSIVEDAVNEAKTSLADGIRLLTAYVKYARGTIAMVKRAEIEAELGQLTNQDDDTMFDGDENDESLMNLIHSTNEDLQNAKSMLEEDEDENNLTVTKDELEDIDLKPGSTVELKMASLNTREGRAHLRAKLAAEATGKEDEGDIHDMSKQKFSDMLDEAHRHTSGDIENEIKVSDDLDYVEDISEINKRMMEVANAPVKVRKEAEALDRLVKEGEVDPADFDELIANGLDKDAVSYWKKYLSQVDGGSEFANELVKEHVKAQMENELNLFKIKMARAYELAYDMVDRGLCHNDKSSISSQVEEIMKFNDDSFDSLKRVVGRHAPLMHKEAGRMPQVGLIGSGEVTSVSDENLVDQLSAALSTTPRRTF